MDSPVWPAPASTATWRMCGSLAHVTNTIPFWTEHPADLPRPPGRGGGDGRTSPRGQRRSVSLGPRRQPCAGDEPAGHRHWQAAPRHGRVRRGDSGVHTHRGELPPIYLATLRDKMLDLALTVADGAIWANASRRYMPTQVARVNAAVAIVLPRQHGADRDRQRPRRCTGHPPANAHRLPRAAQLSQLLEAGGIRAGDGRRSRRRSPPVTETGSRR